MAQNRKLHVREKHFIFSACSSIFYYFTSYVDISESELPLFNFHNYIDMPIFCKLNVLKNTQTFQALSSVTSAALDPSICAFCTLIMWVLLAVTIVSQQKE